MVTQEIGAVLTGQTTSPSYMAVTHLLHRLVQSYSEEGGACPKLLGKFTTLHA